MSIDQKVAVPSGGSNGLSVEGKYLGGEYSGRVLIPENNITDGHQYFKPQRVQTYGRDVTGE